MADEAPGGLERAFEDVETKKRWVNWLFDGMASRYDLGNDLLSLGLHRLWKRRLLRELRLAPGQRVLDVACGTGDITWAMSEIVAEAVGSDVSAPMLNLAEQRRPPGRPNVTFVENSADALPFPDGHFDRVVCSYAARGLPDLGGFVTEAHRVLKPGGELWNLDFAKPPNPVVDVAWRGLLTVWGAILGAILHQNPRIYVYIPVSIRHYAGQRWLEAKMRDVGFTAVACDETTLGLMAYNHGRKAG